MMKEKFSIELFNTIQFMKVSSLIIKINLLFIFYLKNIELKIHIYKAFF